MPRRSTKALQLASPLLEFDDIISCMTSTNVSKNQLDRIENRPKNLEGILLRILNKNGHDDSIFTKLVKSERFQKELKRDLKLLKENPSQFVDVFQTYKECKAQ